MQLFDGIADWLLGRALVDADLNETVQILTRRLLDGGIPLSRMVVGRAQLHPLIAAMDMRWDARSGKIETYMLHRSNRFLEVQRKTPFGSYIDREGSQEDRENNHVRADLTKPEEVERFEIFAQLRDLGVTDYAAWTRAFFEESFSLDDGKGYVPTLSVSFCTNRHSGFSETDIAGFERILVPIFLNIRIATSRYLARELLETYLGRNTGNRVFTGESARGDGETIECVVFFSDLRGSSQLSQELGLEDYLERLNQYFDCVAGSVLDHGGEVLKFVGDGVLAIFPIVEDQRPAAAMCTAALSAAQEAHARAADLDTALRFGIALHVGQVVYGNVGTANRLDYTATGAAVSLTSRCEDLTKSLETPIVATEEFNALCASKGKVLGAHEISGFEEPLMLYGWPSSSD